MLLSFLSLPGAPTVSALSVSSINSAPTSCWLAFGFYPVRSQGPSWRVLLDSLRSLGSGLLATLANLPNLCPRRTLSLLSSPGNKSAPCPRERLYLCLSRFFCIRISLKRQSRTRAVTRHIKTPQGVVPHLQQLRHTARGRTQKKTL